MSLGSTRAVVLDSTLPISISLEALSLPETDGSKGVVSRVRNLRLNPIQANFLKQNARAIAGTARFHDVTKTFQVAAGQTPAGFRPEASLRGDGLLEVDLVRDIGYDCDGIKRPTGVIFSADSANPYEIAPIAPLLGNLTCNPGIVYDLFINNPEANVGNRFASLEEVITEIAGLVGPGVDVSVELENPFEPDFEKILAEIEPYEKILSRYRLVVKVPHMGPVNASNVRDLLSGDKRLSSWYAAPKTEDAFRSHNLALRLQQHGYRVNYTLMFEPYQTALALQARPYFINTFVRQRLIQSQRISALVRSYHSSRDKIYLQEMRTFLMGNDHIADETPFSDLIDVLHYAEDLLAYRRLDDPEGRDGLDSLRHGLRLLKHANLPDTRMIVCSMEGPNNYPDIDKLMAEAEFSEIIDRLVITAEPRYLARFASSNHVVSYQRRFMAAAANAPSRAKR